MKRKSFPSSEARKLEHVASRQNTVKFDGTMNTCPYVVGDFYDGRETAPLSATADMFKRDGKLMNFYDAVLSGKSIGVPGTPALLGELYSKQS